jgi:hypothetical protein
MDDTSRHATRTPSGPAGRFFEDAVSKTRFWWLLLITGVAWVIVSIMILRFNYTTVAAIAVLFGVYCLAAGANQIMVGAVSTSTGWRIWHWLLAILFVVVGVVSFLVAVRLRELTLVGYRPSAPEQFGDVRPADPGLDSSGESSHHFARTHGH